MRNVSKSLTSNLLTGGALELSTPSIIAPHPLSGSNSPNAIIVRVRINLRNIIFGLPIARISLR